MKSVELGPSRCFVSEETNKLVSFPRTARVLVPSAAALEVLWSRVVRKFKGSGARHVAAAGVSC